MSDVHLVGLGGTISMRDFGAGAVPFSSAVSIAERIEGFGGAEDLAKIGGSEVDIDLIERLACRCAELVADGVGGIVVTTGTDSIEEVTTWLAYRQRWPVPIAVTGAMVVGERPDSDGAANLTDALTVVTSGENIDPVVVFAGKVFAAREVLKVSGIARDAFAAPGRGPLAAVAGGVIRWHRCLPRGPVHGRPTAPVVPVPIVVSSLGDDGDLLSYAGSRHPAVIVAANGAGNMPPGQAAAAQRLLTDGVLVVVTTRAADAQVAPIYGYPGGVATLQAAGAVLAPGLSPHRARLLVSLGLAQGLEPGEVRSLIELEAGA